MRATAEGIVERAALGAEHALERLPGKISDVPNGSEVGRRRVELRPELVEGGEERPTGVLAVDLRFDLRSRATVLRLEDEELDEAATVRRRLESPGDDEAHAGGVGARTRQILPRARRNERLDRPRLRARLERLAIVVFVVLVVT